MFNFTNQPWTLLIIGLLIAVIVFMYRDYLKPRIKLILFLAALGVITAGFGIDHFFVSDKEQIKNVILTASKAVENEDVQTFAETISDDYRDSRHTTKQQILRYFNWRLNKPLIKKNITRIRPFEVNSDQATVFFTVRVLFEEESWVYRDYMQQIPFGLEVELEKENGKWRIISAELKTMNLQPAQWESIY